MCCLFGFYNYSGQPIKNLSNLTNCLADEATVRGTDATGIAYNDKNNLIVHKEPRSAYSIDFNHPDGAVCVTGHTRHATQGDKKHNCNNHPFTGRCRNMRFALSHNGVLFNDNILKKECHLPKTKIETDSYVAVQLLEKKKLLNSSSIKYMAEKIHGSFSFSILDSQNTLWLVKGDSPLTLIHIPKYKLYVYASTDEILYKALVETKLFEEIKKGKFEEIKISTGDILNILPNGTITYDSFKFIDYSYHGGYTNWWEYDSDDMYIDDLKSVASCHGYTSDDIDNLLEDGFTPEEIEDYLYY